MLFATPAVKVKGCITGAFDGVNVRLVPESLLRDVSPVSTYASSQRGEFEFSSVEPGRFRLEVDGMKRLEGGVTQTLFGGVLVEAGGADIEGLEVALQPAASVDVAFEESEPGLSAGVSSVELLAVGQSSGNVAAQAGSDTVRRFRPMRPGAYWLRTRTSGEKKVCITGAHLGDRDVFHEMVLLSSARTPA